MNHREQMNLAAKAAGLTLEWKTGNCKGGPFEAAFVDGRPWAPKDNEGDSWRLTVALGIDLAFFERTVRVIFTTPSDDEVHHIDAVLHPDRTLDELSAASRMLVFKAAVAIGKDMP